MKRFAVGLGVLAVLIGLWGCSAPGSGSKPGQTKDASGKFEVLVGANFELSGAIGPWGKESQEGINMAVEEINADPANKFRFKVIFEDNASEDAKSKAAVTKLIHQDRVNVIVGSVASNKTLAAMSVAQEARIPLITAHSTNVNITRKSGEYIFRTCFNDEFQGPFMAKFALEGLKAKTAVLIVQRGNAYSEGLVASYEKAFTEGGGKVLATEAYQQNDTDFQTMAVKIKSANPDCVWLPGYYNEVALIIKQVRSQGFEKPFLGTDGWDNQDLYKLGGPSIKDNYFCNHFSAGDSNPKVQALVKKCEAKYGKKPGAMAALGYEVMYVLADAVKRAGSADPQALRDAIATVKDLETVCGTITMTPEREARKPAVLLKTGETDHIFVKRQ
jgi:branched-chain amino acid transport system substrate-binding protein